MRIFFRCRAEVSYVASVGVLAESGSLERNELHNAGRALTVERNKRPVGPDADNSERLVLADHGESEHFLIKIDGALHIRDLDADMVDLSTLEIDVFLGGGDRSARSQHRKTSH